jgi:hypothetical protein
MENLKRPLFQISILLWAVLSLWSPPAFAWHDETHLAVARAAGYAKWYNAAGPDVAKEKAGDREQRNHFFDNNRNVEITPQLVLEQATRYNDPADVEGHLYGAIIASLREYAKSSREEKYAQYHLAYCAHYIGDLSQPLHNTPYDDFNKLHHAANDGLVERQILDRLFMIGRYIYAITLRRDHFESDLAAEIARIANISRRLGYKLRRENRDMTPEEAYIQLGHSASLLEAVLTSLREPASYPASPQKP